MTNLIDFEIKCCTDKERYCTNDISIILNLENKLVVETGGHSSVLTTNDILLVNSKSEFTLSGTKALYAHFMIHMKQFKQIFYQKRYRFVCDSTNDINDNYGILRHYLTDILVVKYEGKEYQLAEQNKISYELLIFLINNFAVIEFTVENSDRLEQITDYIDDNFQEELTLKTISDEFGMTPQYFSKYFKKEIGTNYYQYLSKIRLEHAVEDMLNTEKNLLHVALDNGFPNSDSFYHCFSRSFQVSPQEYRHQHKKKIQEQRTQYQQSLSQVVNHLVEMKKENTPDYRMEIDVRVTHDYVPYWCEMLNLKNVSLLDDHEGKEQFKILQETLQFHYVRMQLDWNEFKEDEMYSFYIEEREFDYLVNHKLRLWFVIDIRIITEPEKMLAYLKKLISHFANRYSIGTIKHWRFELCYNTIFDEQKIKQYLKINSLIQDVLDSFQIEDKVMGPGIILGNWKSLNTFDKYVQQYHLELPALTLQAEPYSCTETEEGITIRRDTDSSYIKNQLRSFRQNSIFFRNRVTKVYLTNWSDVIMKTNLMNDSCYRGAVIIKNIIDCFGYVDVLAHSIPLDVAYTENLQGKVLFGGDGLISKHGVKKPSYYAYSFMKHMGGYYLTKDEHSIIFGNAEGNYQIACHNCKRLSYHYYSEEDALCFKHFNSYFDDLDSVTLNYHLTNLKNGKYIVKIRSISQEHGSVQDELLRMVSDESINIHENELDYLQQIAVPQVRLSGYTVLDGTLDLQITLDANEFAYIHVIYQY